MSVAGKLFNNIKKQKAITAILVLFVVMPFCSPYFLTAANLSSLVLQVSILLIMALGVTFCIISGDCDLSLGLNMCFCGIMAIELQRYLPLWLIFIVTVLFGAAVGTVNALLVVDQHCNAFITTLGTMMLLRGIALAICDGAPVSGTSQGFIAFGTGKFLGLYYISWVAIVLFFITLYVNRCTAFGRNCYAVGGDKSVAEYSGINVSMHKRITFIISGACAGLAGICMAAQLNSAGATYGDSMALLVNCGVVIGGTPFNGGYGGIVQSLTGIFLLGMMDNVMNLLNISSYYQQLIKGIVIVLVIAMDCYERKRKEEEV